MLYYTIVFLFIYHLILGIAGVLFFEKCLFKDLECNFTLVKTIFVTSFVLCLSLLSMIFFEILNFISNKLRFFLWYMEITSFCLLIYIVIPVSIIFTYVTYDEEVMSQSLFKITYLSTFLGKLKHKKRSVYDEDKEIFKKRLVDVSEGLLAQMENYNKRIRKRTRYNIMKICLLSVLVLPVFWYIIYQITVLTLRSNDTLLDESDHAKIHIFFSNPSGHIDPEFAVDEKEHIEMITSSFFVSIIQNLLMYISVTGMTIVSGLSGFATVYSPYLQIHNFFFIVTARKVKIIERKILFLVGELSSKKKMLLLYENAHLLSSCFRNLHSAYFQSLGKESDSTVTKDFDVEEFINFAMKMDNDENHHGYREKSKKTEAYHRKLGKRDSGPFMFDYGGNSQSSILNLPGGGISTVYPSKEFRSTQLGSNYMHGHIGDFINTNHPSHAHSVFPEPLGVSFDTSRTICESIQVQNSSDNMQNIHYITQAQIQAQKDRERFENWFKNCKKCNLYLDSTKSIYKEIFETFLNKKHKIQRCAETTFNGSVSSAHLLSHSMNMQNSASEDHSEDEGVVSSSSFQEIPGTCYEPSSQIGTTFPTHELNRPSELLRVDHQRGREDNAKVLFSNSTKWQEKKEHLKDSSKDGFLYPDQPNSTQLNNLTTNKETKGSIQEAMLLQKMNVHKMKKLYHRNGSLTKPDLNEGEVSRNGQFMQLMDEDQLLPIDISNKSHGKKNIFRKYISFFLFKSMKKSYRTIQSLRNVFARKKNVGDKKKKEILVQDIDALEYLLKNLYFSLDDVIKEQIRINESTTFIGMLLYAVTILMTLLCLYKIINTCYIIYMVEIHYKYIQPYSTGHVLVLFYAKNANNTFVAELKKVLNVVQININLDNYVTIITSIVLLALIFKNLKTFMEKIIKLRYSTKSVLYSNLAILVMCLLMNLYFSAYCIVLYDYLPQKQKSNMLHIFFNNSVLNLFQLKYHFDFFFAFSVFASLIFIRVHHLRRSTQFNEL